ncbi:hypothetical protein BDP27DRAFT_1404271 [Rhodocollybia butyracea]|uniref:Zn(2)-C6 fungal-type domain-containing protein n=1 Tax=Rhodocollybia butyracea TaxID=206335 RepID=A0A9P5PRB5_9AGAR|nr:hypothetical protein BDP27DRAFT_1404271 [Rhodocollybia butyracea]
MVASINNDLYSPFQHPSMAEEGPQSSEDGSGIHSPVFDSHFPPPHGNDFRYQDQIEDAADILFDYSSSLMHQQQPPLIDAALEIPSPSALHVNLSSDYSVAPRNQLGIEYLPHSSVNSRQIPLIPNSGSDILHYKYISSERRSSGRQSHDNFTRTGESPTDGDQSLSEPSTTLRSNRSGDRKETSTVVIACRQCRSRKIRCDSTRPVCTNCHRRKNLCEYDPEPKRRGPDKRPGTRRRSCKKRPADGSTPPPPKRKKLETDAPTQESTQTKVKERMSQRKRSSSSAKRGEEASIPHQSVPPKLRISTDDLVIQNDIGRRYPSSDNYIHDSAYSRPVVDIGTPHTPEKMVHDKFPPPSSPTMQSEQRDWWLQFLTSYSIKEIASNVEYLFSDTGHWLSFLNLEYFLETLRDPEARSLIRPPLVLAMMAMATLMKSSEAEYGAEGRDRALLLRDSARGALESSWNSGWIDTMLAEAALILTLFEASVHPQYNPDRISTSLLFLDNIIRHLSLTSIDSSDPDVNVYPQGVVPVVNISGPDDPERKCTCIPVDAAHPPDPVTSWSYPPPWDSSWTPLQIRDEECRRVCWCAVALIASYNAQCVSFNRKCPELFLSDCSNFTLLFPGEVIDRASPSYRSADSHSPKESVWALYCRSMLLWNYSNRLCEQLSQTQDSPDLAQEAWSETQAIQDSLEMHVCNLDTALIYMTREYIYNTRVNITQVFRRSVPSYNHLHGLSTRSRVFSQHQAQDWIFYQEQVIKRVKMGIQDITDPRGHQLTRRPFQAAWFWNQLSICLMLFHDDHTLVSALILAKSIVIPIDVMNVLWPCDTQQRHCSILREQLTEACNSAGIDPPLDPKFSIPPALQSL